MPDLDNDRLTSWKEIASFIRCDPRTAQRYERHRGLPVHRVPGSGSATVFAYKCELQKWLDSDAVNSSAAIDQNVSSEVPGDSGSVPKEEPARNLGDPISHTAVTKPNRKHPVVFYSAILLGVVLSVVTMVAFVNGRDSLAFRGEPRRLNDTPFSKAPPLLTDGKRVYFQQIKRGRFTMSWIPLGGGVANDLETTLPNPDPGVVNPQGTAILLRNIEFNKDGDEPLYIQPLPRGQARRLGSIRAYDSTWVPGEEKIYFSRQYALFEATLNGEVTRKIADLPGRAYWYRWSPDGRTLRFTVYDSKTSGYRIWEMNKDNTVPRPVSLGVDHLAQQCCGTWHPSGDAYYFQAFLDGHFQIFMQAAGVLGLTNQTLQLTSGPANMRSPLPLPDGKRVVALSQVQNAELVVFDKGTAKWLPLLPGNSIATAAWSADGNWLAFTKLPDHSLWRCRMPNCDQLRQLTTPPLRVTMPSWSPDGTRIACMVRQLGQPWRAALVATDGSKVVTPLTAAEAEADPDWAPSGDRIVFGAVPNPDRGEEALLRILNLRSHSAYPIPGSQGYHSPRWSPAGDTIAAIKANSDVVGFSDLNRKEWRNVKVSGRLGYPNWSSDGKFLHVLANVGTAEATVMALDPTRLSSQTVAPLNSFRQPTFSFGDWIGLAPDNRPVALRDLSTEAILAWRLGRD
jgi:Tol biopolymer transport system component